MSATDPHECWNDGETTCGCPPPADDLIVLDMTLRTALLDALDDLWANIGTPEANQLQPETVKLCQFVHEVRYHGSDWTDWRHWRLPADMPDEDHLDEAILDAARAEKS